MTKRKIGLTLCVAVFLLAALTFSWNKTDAAESGWIKQKYNYNAPGIEYNPMKGLMPQDWAEGDFPHSLESSGAPLNAIMKAPETYDWTVVEELLNRAAKRGNQVYFGIWIDWPGKPSGMPQFLIDAGVQMRDYDAHNNNGMSKAPDWNNPLLVETLEKFITAMGDKYDGDPRIAGMWACLYGFWGEWHTWPYDNNGTVNWSMKQEYKDRLWKAYHKAFLKTHITYREPTHTKDPELLFTSPYHDASFAYETFSEEWHFWPKVKQAKVEDFWKNYAMGGEIRPEIMPVIFNQWPSSIEEKPAQGENLLKAIEITHPSYMSDYYLFDPATPPTQTQYTNAMKMHRMLGYEFFVSEVNLPKANGKRLDVRVKIQNKGIAPFYERWRTEFAVVDGSGMKVKSLGTVDWNLPEIMPDGKDYVKRFTLLNSGLANGNYKLLMRIVNPLPTGHPLKFANDKQDADITGWLTLGKLQVSGRAVQGIKNTPPSAPSNITVKQVKKDNFYIVWDKSADDVRVASYDVLVNGQKLNREPITRHIGFYATGLKPGTEYSVSVVARDNEGVSSKSSDIMSIRTLNETGTPGTGEQPPEDGALRLEAELFDQSEGNVRALLDEDGSKAASGGAYTGWAHKSDWILFRQLDLSGVTKIRIRAATGAANPVTLELRLGSLEAEPLVMIQVPNTGGWAGPDGWRELEGKVTAASGKQDVYLVFSEGCDIDWIDFIP